MDGGEQGRAVVAHVTYERQFQALEKESQNIFDRLRKSRRLKLQLRSEVSFLRRKLTSFGRSLEGYGKSHQLVVDNNNERSNSPVMPPASEKGQVQSAEDSPSDKGARSKSSEDNPHEKRVDSDATSCHDRAGDVGKDMQFGVMKASLEFTSKAALPLRKYNRKPRVSWQDGEPIKAA